MTIKNIQLNRQRLQEKEYSFEHVFQSAGYEWPGDWEGRALLAFACHYEIDGTVLPCMHAMVEALPEKTNGKLYFGREFDGKVADEQQLSGHNWYLRGLLKYAEDFQSESAMRAAKSTVENLYLPVAGWYGHYPLEREESSGGVSGNTVGLRGGWKLSSDVGCAFMCVDGLAHYYAATGDERVRDFLTKAIGVFGQIDFVRYRFQTHTTLTCARGILEFSRATGDAAYFEIAEKVFQTYLQSGMTLTYENFNWFGRQDSWTEPCAVVDSFILATELYKITKREEYRTLARRIWFNGLQFCQRQNGGAGPNSCVTETQPVWKISMYEAPFCCTMRYAEGLLEYSRNSGLFGWNKNAEITADDFGRRFIDDRLLVEREGETVPAFPAYLYPKEQAQALRLKVLP